MTTGTLPTRADPAQDVEPRRPAQVIVGHDGVEGRTGDGGLERVRRPGLDEVDARERDAQLASEEGAIGRVVVDDQAAHTSTRIIPRHPRRRVMP
jgi:hypothetical protein